MRQKFFTQIAEARAKNWEWLRNFKRKIKRLKESWVPLFQRLISLTENYPELKSNQNVEQLMTELAGSENRIFVSSQGLQQRGNRIQSKIKKLPSSSFR